MRKPYPKKKNGNLARLTKSVMLLRVFPDG